MLDVTRFQTLHALDLRPEYVEFLERFPEGVTELPLPLWPGVVDEQAPASAEKKESWRSEVAEIYGLDSLDALYDGADGNGEIGFWNRRLLRHAYVVARTYSGDPIVQVTHGKDAGAILLTNHESYHGFFEHLASLIPNEAQSTFLKETGKVWKKLGVKFPVIETDAVVGFLLHKSFDGATRIADSFRAFYAELATTRGAQERPAQPRRVAPVMPKVQTALTSPVGEWGYDLSASTVDDGRAYFMGNWLEKTILHTTRDGETFENREVPHPKGIDLFVRGEEVWICGGERLLIHSTDGGASFRSVPLDLGGDYHWGVTKDDAGVLWVLGSKGRVAISSNDGGTFDVLEPEGKFSEGRLWPSRHGVLIPSGWTLRLGVDGKIRHTGLKTKGSIDAVLVTSSGALLTADRAGEVHRSTDGGETWTKSRVLTKDPLRGMLSCLTQTADGRVFAGGGMGFVAVSHDDGVTFWDTTHGHIVAGGLQTAESIGNVALLAGPGSHVLRAT